MIETRKAFIADLLQGKILGEGPVERQMCVAEDVVYLNARHLARWEFAWLKQALLAADPSGTPAALVLECMTPGYGELRDMYYFERPGLSDWGFAERIAISAHPNASLGMVKWLSANVIDNESAFPGVGLMRARGPRTPTAVIDTVVLWTTGAKATVRVVEALGAYQKRNPSHFLDQVPSMTRPVLPGVAVCEEPSGAHVGRDTFATLRVRLMQEAMQEATSEADFKALVKRRFIENGIDWDNPDRNARSAS